MVKQEESNQLRFLLQALISVTPDEETNDEEDAAFCLEMLLRIVLENRYGSRADEAGADWDGDVKGYALCFVEIVCRACGRRCGTISTTSVSMPLRAASWWSGPWWDSSGLQSASCDVRTSALRYPATLTCCRCAGGQASLTHMFSMGACRLHIQNLLVGTHRGPGNQGHSL